MTKKQIAPAEVSIMSSQVPEEEWTSEYQEIYYDPNIHRFVYLSEDDASALLGVPVFGD